MPDHKIGVFLCTGCGIGDSLEGEKFSRIVTGRYKIPLFHSHPCLCSEEGIQHIRGELEEKGLQGLVVAACSPRAHADLFDFGPSIPVERVNLREQGVWTHPPQDEDTQMLAEDNLRMGIVRAQKTQPPAPYLPEGVERSLLVVGGGIAGMTAAREAARAGYEVLLVEREASLGGQMARLHRQFPKHPPYRDPEEPGIEALIQKIQGDPQIRVYTSSEIEKISGSPGMFEVTLKCVASAIGMPPRPPEVEERRSEGAGERGSGGKEVVLPISPAPLPPSTPAQFRVGAIVLATGWRPYDATRLEPLGFGRYPNVVTSLQMEEMAFQGNVARPSEGKKVRSVAFVQCAGSRDANHLPYCSAACCMTSLKQAIYLRERDPETKVYLFYQDMRTPGPYENFYQRVQEDPGIFFAQGDVLDIREDGEKNLLVEVDHALFGERIQVKVDLVVLATGMVPTTLDDSAFGNGPQPSGPVSGTGEDASSRSTSHKGESSGSPSPAENPRPKILHLDYRQGPELPILGYGFPDSNYLCFPYETQRTGIYAAGCVRQPMDSAASMEDGMGAALKAIQCIELTARGEAAHPRAGDRSYPELFMHRCTQCKRCTEECPFGMYNEDGKYNPLPNPTRCRRCGICMGSCPERIISFKDYSVDMIGSMIKAIEVPEEEEEKPRILALVCENDAYPALDMAGIRRLRYTPFVRFIPLRCLGSLNLVWIADALAKGIDGVLLLGCKHGEDSQCHFIKGSELAEYRLGKVQETLQRLVLGPERIRFVQVSIADYPQLPGIIDEFAEKINAIGPNPYKGL
ncbi:MAG: FAD-dependent oxidoreductase [Nitrospinae bacterium]|nr:FAD-dependent oxidoreductase [Nitrospinota bacterium]